MKTKLIPAAIVFSVVASSNAATNVGINNFNIGAGQALAITDNTGAILTNVNFGVGSFAAGFDFASATPESIAGGFTPLGNGNTGANAFFNTSVSVASSPQDSSDVYVVFYGNADSSAASDFASAADYIVIQGPGAFVAEDPVLQTASVGNPIQEGALLYGISTDADTTGQFGPFANFNDGVTFGVGTAIPEPSSVLLSVLGLAFVARRRR